MMRSTLATFYTVAVVFIWGCVGIFYVCGSPVLKSSQRLSDENHKVGLQNYTSEINTKNTTYPIGKRPDLAIIHSVGFSKDIDDLSTSNSTELNWNMVGATTIWRVSNKASESTTALNLKVEENNKILNKNYTQAKHTPTDMLSVYHRGGITDIPQAQTSTTPETAGYKQTGAKLPSSFYNTTAVYDSTLVAPQHNDTIGIVHTTGTDDLPILAHSEQLDDAGKYMLYWQSNEQDITFEVHVKTKGYVGFGLSRYGGMFPSDVIIGGVRNDQAYFADFHTMADATPIIDESQDWSLLFASENNSQTVLRFRRALDTCDEYDRKIDDGLVNVIYAYHESDPVNHDSASYHGILARGHKRISLLNPDRKLILPVDVKTHDFQNVQVAVPAKQTSYNCRIVKPPSVHRPHHVIAFEPLVEAGNEMYVHHIMVYGCVHLDSSYQGYLFDCVEERILLGMCTDTYAVLTKGTGEYQLPGHVGFSIGKPSDPQMLMVQIHYNNPEMVEGVTDSSGVRLYYTPTLRDHDAGVLLTGMMSNPINIMIPPNYSNFLYMGHCPADCLERGIPKGYDSIHIIAVTHHTHILGRKAITRHIRNGTELEPLAIENRLNFNYQGKLFLDDVTVKKGDVIRVECEFDTLNQRSFTHGGYSSNDEMCLAQIIYYPKMELEQCYSMPVYNQLGDNMREIGPQIESWDYTDQHVRERYQRVAMDSRHRFLCQGTGSYQTTVGISQPPVINDRYVNPETNCTNSII